MDLQYQARCWWKCVKAQGKNGRKRVHTTPDIDFNETFSPVARMDTIRTILAIVAKNKWLVYQMDFKSAFLNGYLEEEVYVEQPQG